MLMGDKAIFLDRDGTLNLDTHYAHKVEDMKILPGVVDGLKIMKRYGYKLIVVTNQGGIGKGLYKEEDVHKFHDAMIRELERDGVKIDAFYFCPHHPSTSDCECRKPKTGMIDQAIKEFGIDTSKSFMIGDNESDIGVGHKAGCKAILVKTGNYKNRENLIPDYTAVDLVDAAGWIVEEESK